MEGNGGRFDAAAADDILTVVLIECNSNSKTDKGISVLYFCDWFKQGPRSSLELFIFCDVVLKPLKSPNNITYHEHMFAVGTISTRQEPDVI